MLFLVFIRPSGPYSPYSPLRPRAPSAPNALVVGYTIASIVVITMLIKFNII